eukprot:4243339-Lingulodinium_polyedra.AAC.1
MEQCRDVRPSAWFCGQTWHSHVFLTLPGSQWPTVFRDPRVFRCDTIVARAVSRWPTGLTQA